MPLGQKAALGRHPAPSSLHISLELETSRCSLPTMSQLVYHGCLATEKVISRTPESDQDAPIYAVYSTIASATMPTRVLSKLPLKDMSM